MSQPVVYGLYHKGKLLGIEMGSDQAWSLKSLARRYIPELQQATTVEHIEEAMAREGYRIKKVRVIQVKKQPKRHPFQGRQAYAFNNPVRT